AFSPDKIRELLSDAGFVAVEIVGKRLGPIASLASTPAPVARILDRLADRLPKLSDHVVAFARHP
ncbi:MAG: hypothetical protein QOG81_856, partial [Gaiellaceae bacterium]|nr:hypothetical protein [Gaiellaceae bacterium]